MGTLINLVGSATSSSHLAPTDSDSWVCGWHYEEFKHLNVTRIYEVHECGRPMNKEYQKKLVDLGIPMVVSPKFLFKADHVRVFDFDRAEDLVGRLYLTSTMAYMMADAIAEKNDAIHLYGITLTADSEYYFQRACMEWWRGFAEGRGIEIYVPENCPLGKSDKIYGRVYEDGIFGEDSLLEIAREHRRKIEKIRQEKSTLDMMETAQMANAELLEKLAFVAERHGSDKFIKRLSDVIKVN